MTTKQPRVPEYAGNKDGNTERYIRTLVLFLKDFCMEVWTAERKREKEMKRLREQIQALSQHEEKQTEGE